MMVEQLILRVHRAASFPAPIALTAWLAASATALAVIGPSELWQINADGTGLKLVVETPGETAGSSGRPTANSSPTESTKSGRIFSTLVSWFAAPTAPTTKILA
jgi:hypothetical protein